MRAWLAERSIGDILVLMIASTICVSVLAGGAAIAYAAIANPGGDYGKATVLISDILTTLVSLLAGFLAGRTDATVERGRAEPDSR